MNFPDSALKHWFKKQARDLPWRKTKDPYAIWVSEVMLQQTQVKTVLGYYERWMKRFPTLEALAIASQEEVIKNWEGLGYYSRARNLQKGAKEILKLYEGKLPSTREELLKIKGIGPYTVGALLSFAFKKRSVLIDGNVKRVLSRFFTLEDDFSIQKNHRKLEALIETILPQKEPWIFNEALMELGALICQPKTPQCEMCPLAKTCQAKKENRALDFPKKAPRKKQVRLHRLVFILEHQGTFALKKQAEGVMQDLYEFPYEELSQNELIHFDIEPWLKKKITLSHQVKHALPSVTHGFTHHHVTLYPYWIELDQLFNHHEYLWLSLKEIDKRPFSSGHRKILQALKKSMQPIFLGF